MIELVISGGQTGADQAGWRAAKAAGIATGGWMPRGWLTEKGFRPEFSEMYAAKEHPVAGYPARTMANVRMNGLGLVLWFGNTRSPGARCTLGECDRIGIEYVSIQSPNWLQPKTVAISVEDCIGPVLMVAGNRESSSPGIGEWVESYLAEVFRLVKEAS